MLQRLVGSPPRPVDVRLERALPLLGAELLRVIDRRLRSRVVHDDVQRAELFDGVGHDAAGLVLLLHVAPERDRAPALGLHELLGARGVVVLREVRDCHVSALLRERDADRTADARVASRHERDAPVELARSLVGPHLVLRLGRHLALLARAAELLWRKFLLVVTHAPLRTRAGTAETPLLTPSG